MKKNIIKKSAGILLLFILSGIGLVYALGTTSTGYKLPAQITSGGNSEKTEPGTVSIINAHGVSRTISNTSAIEYFIPTKTASEWLDVRSNLPSGVTCFGLIGSVGGC